MDSGNGGSGWQTLLYSVKDGLPYELDVSRTIQGFNKKDGIYYTTENEFLEEGGHKYLEVELIYNSDTQQFTKGQHIEEKSSAKFDETQPVSDGYKNLYKSLIQGFSLAGSDTISTIDYTLYDMNQDGIPELITKTGTCEADFKLSFYTYDDEIGLIPIGTDFQGFHIGFYIDRSTGQFCTKWGQMGVGGIAWYSFDGNSVSEFKRQDNIEYATPNVNFENYDDAYAPYGDFESLNTTYCFYSWDEGWVTSENEDSKAGIDYSMIDNYR